MDAKIAPQGVIIAREFTTMTSRAWVISTGRKTASGSAGSAAAKRGSFSQLNTWFAFTSYRRATCETETPGTRVCAQIIRFSS